jgi:hypothetical protein
MADMAEARARGLDHAPAHAGETGVKSEDAQRGHADRQIRVAPVSAEAGAPAIAPACGRNRMESGEKKKKLVTSIDQMVKFRKREGEMREIGRKPVALVTRSPDSARDLSDLPPEVLNELGPARTDVLTSQILTVLQSLGGRGDLDDILIGLYRNFHVVLKRRFLQNKIWRMTRKGQVLKIKGERGVFRANPARTERRRKSRA